MKEASSKGGDKKVEYARSVFLHARRPHTKSGIG
jgi:hypothetical protein